MAVGLCGDEGGHIIPPQSTFDITENGTYLIEQFRYVDVRVEGGECDVTSVNGQTGDVVLAASDVGALPDTYTPPVTSVNSQTGDVVIAVPSEATAPPLVDGTAAVGISAKYAKEDHVHPTDTGRAAATSVPDAATIDSSGLITFKNGSTSLFTLQLPLYNGGVI